MRSGRFSFNSVMVVVTTLVMLVMVIHLTGCIGKRSGEKTQQVQMPLDLVLKYHAGMPLAGPVNEEVQLAQDINEQSYEFGIMLLDYLPVDQGLSLSTYARLITTTNGESAVLPASLLTQHVRWDRGSVLISRGNKFPQDNESFQHWLATTIKWQSGLLTDKATLVIDTPWADGGATAVTNLANGDKSSRVVSLALRRVETLPADPSTSASADKQTKLRLALSITDVSEAYRRARRAQRTNERKASGEEDQRSEAQKQRSAQRLEARATETILADLPFEDGNIQGQLIVPFEVPGTPWQSLVIMIKSTDQTASNEQVNEVNASLARSREQAASLPTLSSKKFASDYTDLVSAIELLKSGSQRRAAMVYLAGRTGATLLGNLALVADDVLLDLMATRIGQAVKTQQSENAAALGWLMDRACLAMLVEQQGERSIRDTQGVVSTYLGEVARRPSIMEELLESSGSRESFDTRLHVENVISLEDEMPSSRVRAFNWLNRRGLAPNGYDPLAAAHARREALSQAGDPGGEASEGLSELSGEALPMVPSLGPLENETTPVKETEGTR